MDSIRIRNLRCLEDTGVIALRPITILLGKNSSGKSTFIRTLPLLRQTAEARTLSPLLWFGRLVDFGSFNDALYENSSKEEMIFNFGLGIMVDPSMLFRGSFDPVFFQYERGERKLIEINAEIHIANDPTRHMAYASEVNVIASGHKIKLTVDANGKLGKLLINGTDLSPLYAEEVYHPFGTLIPIPKLKPQQSPPLKDSELVSQREAPEAWHTLAKFVQTKMHGNTSIATAMRVSRGFKFGTTQEILKRVTDAFKTRKSGGMEQWTDATLDFKTLQDYIIAISAAQLLRAINEQISATCSEIKYIQPLRATADRYYRFHDLAVDEIDSQGQNLAMFIHALKPHQLLDLQSWTNKYFGFTIDVETKNIGHLSLLINESSGKHNLADVGFGYSQVLPIAIQLWWQNQANHGMHYYTWQRINKSTGILAIEQPELHLHPKLQALVADAFVAAVTDAKERKCPLCIVVETHSETIINRIGELIATGKIANSEVSIVLFDREAENLPAKVRIAEYDSCGYLKNWPYGFFTMDK